MNKSWTLPAANCDDRFVFSPIVRYLWWVQLGQKLCDANCAVVGCELKPCNNVATPRPLIPVLPELCALLATSQQYSSLRTNQPPATSQQYFSLRTNQPPAKRTG
jgi:hypothetical protein